MKNPNEDKIAEEIAIDRRHEKLLSEAERLISASGNYSGRNSLVSIALSLREIVQLLRNR